MGVLSSPPKPISLSLSLLTLLTLFLASHARLTLHPADSHALSTLLQGLGINFTTNPCALAGVFCQRRLAHDHTYLLRLTTLVFQSRRLAGFISPAIGDLSELRELSLSGNTLTGQIPPQIARCKRLEILDLKENQLTGQVPSNLSALTNLRLLDLSSNHLSGSLNFLKYLPNLEIISLANNNFLGEIPESIRSFRNLHSFDFSGNSFLEGATMSVDDQYPKRYIFAENSRNSSGGASAAAQGPITAEAPGPSASTNRHHKGKKRKARSWIIGFFVGLPAGGLIGFVSLVLFKVGMATIRGRGKDTRMVIFSKQIKKAEYLAFLEKDDGVSSLEVIGKGGCGEVYKAPLPGSEGKFIAIKKVNQPAMNAADLTHGESKDLNRKMRQIRSEITTVGQIRHRNLLPLMAHVPRPDCHFLVYEFMKNGSLQDALNDVAQGRRELDWPARHRIALGIAAGLEYLHIEHNPRIIHRDLKPANVLLDDGMEARIADFGLAKAMPDAHTHITSSSVAGTIGYIAPEYHQTLKFTEKCDIYSFGVVLGVLVMGKLPSDEFFQHTEEMGLVRWMRRVMTSENPEIAIDPKLRGNEHEDQLLLVLKVACFCTLDNPKERPNSKDVRCMLDQIGH